MLLSLIIYTLPRFSSQPFNYLAPFNPYSEAYSIEFKAIALRIAPK